MRKVLEKILAVFVILILFSRVFPAAGMEMGGFDIEVGVGEQSDFPDTGSFEENSGSSSDSGSIQENEEISSGGGVSSDNFTSNTTESGQNSPAVSGSDGQNMTDSSQNIGQTAPASSENSVQTAPVFSQTTGQNASSSSENVPVSSQSTGQNAPVSGQNSGKKEAAFNEYTEQKNKKQSSQVSSHETKWSSGSTADISEEKSASGDTVSPSPVPTVTLTPNPEPSPVPELFFYQKKTDDEIPKRELEIYYHKEIVSDSGTPPFFLILSDSPVSVLSVRINEEESLWHWEESSLILDVNEVQKDSCVELIAVYEEGAEIRVFCRKLEP